MLMSIARKYLLLSALLGAAVSLALFCLLMVSYNENGRLESRVEALERQVNQESEARNQVAQMAGPGVATSPSDQLFKDLSTRFVGDARTIAEKLNDFLKRSEEHTSELQSRENLVCRLLLEKKKKNM